MSVVPLHSAAKRKSTANKNRTNLGISYIQPQNHGHWMTRRALQAQNSLKSEHIQRWLL